MCGGYAYYDEIAELFDRGRNVTQQDIFDYCEDNDCHWKLLNEYQIMVIDPCSLITRIDFTKKDRPVEILGFVREDVSHDESPAAIVNSVPMPTAEKWLSFFILPDRLEEVIGDLDEGFVFMQTRHGIGHARRWYWY